MVKNTGGGNKAKSKARKDFKKDNSKSKDELRKHEGEEYGYVMEKFSDSNMRIFCNDKKSRLGITRGYLKYKHVRFSKGDIVLVSLRDFEDGKCDISYKYDPDEVKIS